MYRRLAHSFSRVIIHRISCKERLISSRSRAGDVLRLPPTSTYALIASRTTWETLMCLRFAIVSSCLTVSSSSLMPICFFISLLSNGLLQSYSKTKAFPILIDISYQCFIMLPDWVSK